MINREEREVKVRHFTNEVDDYGQPRLHYTDTNTVMLMKIYSQTNTSDVRYVDVNMIGLTRDTSITDKNQIVDGDDVYNVLYVIPSNRYTQVLMKKA